jgi:hypothetical protein
MFSKFRTYVIKLIAFAVGIGVYSVMGTLVYLDFDHVMADRVQLMSWVVTSLVAFSLLYNWSKYSEIVHEFSVLLVLASHRRERWMDNLRRFKHRGVAIIVQKIVESTGLFPRDEHCANAYAAQIMWRVAKATTAAGLLLLVLLPDVRLQVALSTIAALTLNRLLRRALADAAWMQEWGHAVMRAQKGDPFTGIIATLIS